MTKQEQPEEKYVYRIGVDMAPGKDYSVIPPHPQEQWMEERRKEIVDILTDISCDCNPYGKYLTRESVASDLLTLLTVQIEAAEKRGAATARAHYYDKFRKDTAKEVLEQVERTVEKMIDSFRCPIHQQKGSDGNWYILPPDHKLCHEGWVAPRGDIALEQFLASLTNHNP